MTSKDKNLVDRFRCGDVAAFDELYGLMHERIYRFALRLTGHTQDAEDVTVQTFLEAYRARESFRGSARIETWLYRIAVFSANRAKRARRHQPMPEEDLLDRFGNDGLEAVELQMMLRTLPENLQTPFVLVKIEGMTHKEAAEIMGRRLGTVQAQVFQASRLLRAQLQADLPPVLCDRAEGCRQ